MPVAPLAHNTWHPPLPPALLQRRALEIDLSASNPGLPGVAVDQPEQFGNWVAAQCRAAGCEWAFGGYGEDRAIYSMSPHFGAGDTARSVHLGVDFWLPAGTPVYAAAAGTVHSFADNHAFGDYGPTIVVRHPLPSGTLYSLYGHLARSSLNGLAVGQPVEAGTPIATLGTPAENVGWAPHLHFQLIAEIGSHVGDFPGVCARKDADQWLARCPSPMALINAWCPNRG